LLLLAIAIAISILLVVAFLGPLWEQFDKMILKTEARRYLFATLFVSVLFAIGEWLVRSYRRAKQRAAARLEAQYSVFLN
jgi:type VI protein secretion system component VasK